MAKKDEAISKINEISDSLGLAESEKTIFEIMHDEENGSKTLTLKNGSWANKEPWFGIDEKGDLHTMVSVKSMTDFLESYKAIARENFDLRLEKSILKQIPIDFGDVWVVCMDELKNIAEKNDGIQVFKIDLDKVVENVKLKYPNLFVDMEKYIKR